MSLVRIRIVPLIFNCDFGGMVESPSSVTPPSVEYIGIFVLLSLTVVFRQRFNRRDYIAHDCLRVV
jgi:hypothetical protein